MQSRDICIMRITKSAQAISAVHEHNWKLAFKLIKDFRIGISKEDAKIVSQAYECLVHPQFYQSLKIDLDARISLGKQVAVNYVKSLEK